MIELRRIDNEASKLSIKATDMERDAYRALAETLKGDVSAAMDELSTKKAAFEGNWANGMNEAVRKYSDQATKIASTTEQAFTSAFGRMEDAIVQFTMTGKLNFSDFAKSIIADIIKIQTREAMSKAMSAASGFLGSLFGGASPDWAGAAASDFAGSSFQFAKGGVVSSPSLSAYSGQIVSKPTTFAFAKGGGLMGEAGPEAILPLKRGSDGKLGISGGAGGGGDNYVTITINQDGDTTQESDGNAETKQLAKQLESVVLQVLATQKRPGGMLHN